MIGLIQKKYFFVHVFFWEKTVQHERGSTGHCMPKCSRVKILKTEKEAKRNAICTGNICKYLYKETKKNLICLDFPVFFHCLNCMKVAEETVLF